MEGARENWRPSKAAKRKAASRSDDPRNQADAGSYTENHQLCTYLPHRQGREYCRGKEGGGVVGDNTVILFACLFVCLPLLLFPQRLFGFMTIGVDSAIRIKKRETSRLLLGGKFSAVCGYVQLHRAHPQRGRRAARVCCVAAATQPSDVTQGSLVSEGRKTMGVPWRHSARVRGGEGTSP